MEKEGIMHEENEWKNAKYKAVVKRDEKILKTFVKFSNRVRHPRATVFMVSVGAMLVALPIANREIALPGVIICFVMGPLLFLMGLFRHYIGTQMLKNNPETKLDEEITYIFGNTDVKTARGDVIEKMGSYAKIYRLWENEKIFFIGMNEDDLVVIPKCDFVSGDVDTFRDFILEKSGCIYTWQPNRVDNIVKHYITSVKWKMQKQSEEAKQRTAERKNRKE